MNSNAALFSLCYPTRRLIQIIPIRHRVLDKAISIVGSGAGQMPSYRVSFFNDIPRDKKLFHYCQRSIVVRAARSPERAVEAGKKRFARLEGICKWNIHASRVELEEIDLPVVSEGALRPAPSKRKRR